MRWPTRLSTLVMCALAAACGDRPAPARRVILITCDTLRADHLGVYGYERPTSPQLDAFAQQAVVYEQAYSCAPLTAPALSSLMAGRIPEEIGVCGGNYNYMPASVETLAEAAAAAGIPTGAIVSNWVLRRPKPEAGDVGLSQGFDSYDDHLTERELNRRSFERAAPATTDAAIAWMAARLDAGQDRYFLWVHYQDPHGPYTPPAEIAKLFDRPPGDEPLLPIGTTVSGFGEIPKYQALDDERRPGVYRDRYDAEIRFMDENVGRLLGWLAEHSLWDDSLIVFTADHGEALGDHGYWFCHGENTYREAVRVPLLVHYPTASAPPDAAPGRRRPELVGHLDLFPTLLEALGLPPQPRIGRSLFSSGIEPGRTLPQSLGVPGTKRRWEGITDGRWHLVMKAGASPQLFDLIDDSHEAHDLAGEQPQEVAELNRAYSELLKKAGSLAPAAERVLSNEDREAFDALGYVGGDDDGG